MWTNRSKPPSCEAMGMEAAESIRKINTAPVFEPLAWPSGPGAAPQKRIPARSRGPIGPRKGKESLTILKPSRCTLIGMSPRGGLLYIVDELVSELIRPMLKTWLDDNLPALAERLVRTEIERISRAKRLKADELEDRLAPLRHTPEPPRDLSLEETEIWRATVDGMKAQDLMRDFDEFCAQVKKLDAGYAGGIEKTTDIKEYQAALATFRAACERLAGSIALRQGRIHGRGLPPPPPRGA